MEDACVQFHRERFANRTLTLPVLRRDDQTGHRLSADYNTYARVIIIFENSSATSTNYTHMLYTVFVRADSLFFRSSKMNIIMIIKMLRAR